MAKRVYIRKRPFTRSQLLRLTGDGRFCTICFYKRTTGDLRVMNCRTGVKRYVTGVGLKFTPAHKNLISVFDTQKKAYRFISVEGVIRVDAHGKSYQVSQ